MELRGYTMINWMRDGWSKLTVTPDCLVVNGWGATYTFSPEQVISIRQCPWYWYPAIRIRHNVPEYPAQILFGCYTLSSHNLLKRIYDTGFRSAAPRESAQRRSAMPVRWSVVIAVVVMWNVLFALADSHSAHPGDWTPYHLLPVGLLFITTLATSISPRVQSWVLEPGRSVTEIQPWLTFLALISGGMTLAMAVTTLL